MNEPLTSNPLALSRVIPEHVETVRFRWLQRRFTTMTQEYRRIRAKCEHPLCSCDWCGVAFLDGELIALAQPEKEGRNWVLCGACATAAETPDQL